MKKEKSFVEKCNAKQQEKIHDFKRKRKENKALLKEVVESNIRLYWYNVVLTTKLKQRDTKASIVIIPWKSKENMPQFWLLNDFTKIVKMRIFVLSTLFKWNFLVSQMNELNKLVFLFLWDLESFIKLSPNIYSDWLLSLLNYRH